MADQPHFKYEGNVTLRRINLDKNEIIEVRDVKFLMPASVTTFDGQKESQMILNVDLANKTAFYPNGQPVSDHVRKVLFSHIDGTSHVLDESFFEAGEDIYEKVQETHEEFETLQKDRGV